MEYKLGVTKAIHWDEESIYKIRPSGTIIWKITADVFAVHKGILPIIVVAKPTVTENNITVFSAILHTKAFLYFKQGEEPINDIIKMWNDCYQQEVKKFRELGVGTIIEHMALEDMETAMFNSAYHLREAAIKFGLVEKK